MSGTATGSPQVSQGFLNRVRGNIQVASYPALNVTASFLGRAGYSLSWGRGATTFIDNMTGRTISPEPYQPCTLEIHLVKAQALAAAWEAQRVSLSAIGNVLAYTTSSALSPYALTNMAIENVAPLQESGESAEYVLTLSGTYIINNQLWALTI